MKIIWTDFAVNSLKEIFDYYAINANKKVAHNIRNQILIATRQLRHQPESGQIEPHLKKLKLQYRYIVCGNYKVIYKIDTVQIVINDVFDTRQNPLKIERDKL